MSVHVLENLDSIDPVKVARRREKLQAELDFWLRFGPPSHLSLDGIGVILPLSDALLDALAFHRNWPLSELRSVLACRSEWFYCPELDAFISWADYRTGLVSFLQNVVLGDSLRP